VNDLLGARFPPEQVIKLAKGGGLNKEQFSELETRVKSFFEGYQWTEEDTIMMGQLLLDPDIYDVTKTLRRKITHKSELAGVVEKEASLDSVLRRLEQAQVITKFGENGIEVAANDDPLIVLMADVHFESFFPEFLVLRIQERLEAKDIHPDIAKRHLELLSETYMRMREKMKERKKRKEEEEKAEEELPEMEGEMVPPPEQAEVETPEALETTPMDEEEAKRIQQEEKKARKEEEKRLKEEEKRLKAEEKQKKKDEEKVRKEEEKRLSKEEKEKLQEEEKRLKEEEKQKKKDEEQKQKDEEKKRKEEEKKKKKEEKEKEKEKKKEKESS
jgi:hypothetical protein